MSELNIGAEDASIVGNPPTIDQARRTLVGDFYGSFRFSQGDGNTQNLLFRALATTYRRSWTPEGMDTVLPEALEAAQEQAVHVAPPVKHLSIPSAKLEAEVDKQWGTFSKILETYATKKPRTNLIYGTLRWIMPYWDSRHVALGRANRPDEAETYESYYRTYVLSGQPTHSEAFDQIFSSLRERQLRTVPPLTLDSLQAAWELRHKGESFYPESFRNDLKDSSLLTRLGYVSLTRHITAKSVILLVGKIRGQRVLQTQALPANTKDESV